MISSFPGSGAAVELMPLLLRCRHQQEIVSMPPTNQELVTRFWAKVDKQPGPCWLWTGATTGTHGYGCFHLNGANGPTIGAHRFSFELHLGPIPKGLTLDHLCRVKNCVNPFHLEPVTHRENVLRGIGPSAVNARKTCCLRGHKFTLENTYVNSVGNRRCRACKNLRYKKLKERSWG